MADQDMMHTAEIMKAALPFIDPKTRVMAEFFTKIFDLMGSLKAMTGVDRMAACGYENSKVDMEGMLTAIRPLCSNKEREIVDRILSMFNAKRMFEMYNNLMSTMKMAQEFAGDASDTAGGFSGFNFDSIFGNSTNKTQTPSESEPETKSDFFEGFEHSGDTNSSSEKEQSAKTGNQGNNKMMFDMLKTMVPPEQMSTFENLSMLLNTMSYDNNSKPDDSKEHVDG
jgi:hypothetical protein